LAREVRLRVACPSVPPRLSRSSPVRRMRPRPEQTGGRLQGRDASGSDQLRVGPPLVADGLAELQVRRPSLPIVFCETRQLAEEWTCRYLFAVMPGPGTEAVIADRTGPHTSTRSRVGCTSLPQTERKRGPRRARASRDSPSRTAAGCYPNLGGPGATLTRRSRPAGGGPRSTRRNTTLGHVPRR
jgi:hypothetical protein